MSNTLLQDQASSTLTVGGREIKFVFNKRDGGEAKIEGSKTPPGGGRSEKAHGGRQTVDDLTLIGEFVPDRDHADVQFLKTQRGKAPASVVENGLDADGNVFIRLNGWTGVVSGVSTGNYDAKSSAPREIVVEVETDGLVS